MFIKIRNWAGEDLREKHPELYKALCDFPLKKPKEVYVKCFDYHHCWVVDTDKYCCKNSLDVLLQTICVVLRCDVTVKYVPFEFSKRVDEIRKYLGCYPALEIWLNDGSEHYCETPDPEDDGWWD